MSDPMPGRPNDFVVRLEGLKLDEAARNRIAGAIQAAVLKELGTIDLSGSNPANNLIHIPITWRGIIYRNLAKLPGDVANIGQNLRVMGE
jgi:hypothetical protein